MMNFVEWVLWSVFAPDRFIVWMLAIGSVLLARPRGKWGRRLVVIATGLLLIVAILPVEQWFLGPLERRFVVPDLSELRVDGIIVLAGAGKASATLHWSQPVLGESAERLTEGIGLALRHPEALLVFSDGAWDSTGEPLGAVTAKQLLKTMAADSLRVVYEERSTNTRENARFTKELVNPSSGERWVLVTSAFHMPRSFGAFQAVGWDVIPYPVDFRTGKGTSFTFQPAGSLVDLALGIREWIALAVYRMRGHTPRILPGA
jgi:uncharacterized SAM-binding protein YcdF (DUF218 family)